MSATVHADARCAAKSIGVDTTIAAFAAVGEGATIGAGCHIGGHVTVEMGVKIGDGVFIDAGARILAGVVVGDRARVGANAVVGSSRDSGAEQPEATLVERDVVIGAGALVLQGVRVGLNSVVRPGAVVAADVPANAIVGGNPARIVGYVDAPRNVLAFVDAASVLAEHRPQQHVDLDIGGTALWELPRFFDLRGSLVPLEFEDDLPFQPRRQFFVFDVPGEEVRGQHAHRTCAQFLVAVSGSLSVVVDDARSACEVRLDRPNVGLLLPPGVWGVQYKFTQGAVLAVFASEPYDDGDYIRDYGEFLRHSASRSE